MRTILGGYDETEPSKRALDRAVTLAQTFRRPPDPRERRARHPPRGPQRGPDRSDRLPASPPRRARARALGLVDRVLRPSVSQSVARMAHRDVMIVHPGSRGGARPRRLRGFYGDAVRPAPDRVGSARE
jgi:hypothetical protein